MTDRPLYRYMTDEEAHQAGYEDGLKDGRAGDRFYSGQEHPAYAEGYAAGLAAAEDEIEATRDAMAATAIEPEPEPTEDPRDAALRAADLLAAEAERMARGFYVSRTTMQQAGAEYRAAREAVAGQ